MHSPFARPRYWVTPPASILTDVGAAAHSEAEYSTDTVAALMSSCGASVAGCSVVVGASVAQYHINLRNVRDLPRIKRIVPMLEAELRRSVILSKSECAHLALSVSRDKRDVVPLKTAMLTKAFGESESCTAAVLGTDTTGGTVSIDIAKMPHLLIAGATGSGKSVLLHSIIGSLLFKATPSRLQFIMIDPKQVELTMYDGLPHLARPVVTDVSTALLVLERVCDIMDARYRDIRKGKTDHTRMIVVIDELADLMLTSRKAVEPAIVRIAQLGRAAGIHLIVATQRPTVNVVTGLIKANMPARIALTMASYRDAGVMEVRGADKLAGCGDALFQGPDHTKQPVRFQGAYVSQRDTAAIVGYWTSSECTRS